METEGKGGDFRHTLEVTDAGEYAVIGPVDPQLGQYPAASILKAVVARKPVAEVDDNTLILADQAEKAMTQLRDSVQDC